MRVLIVEPLKKPYLKDIEPGLKSYQKIVGGDIEAVYPYEDMVALVGNDESKILGMPLNRALKDDDGEIYDIIAGTFFVCGIDEENFISLNDDLAVKFYDKFRYSERFGYNSDKKIWAEKCYGLEADHELFPLEKNEIVNDLLDRPGYQILNSNSILESDKEENQHAQENEKILEYLANDPCFQHGLIVKIVDYDIAFRDGEARYYIVKDAHDLNHLLQVHDFKNGCDFGISPDEGLAIAMYGSGYEYKEQSDFKKTLFVVHPIKEYSGTEQFHEIPFHFYINIHKQEIQDHLVEMQKSIQKTLKKKERIKDDRSR